MSDKSFREQFRFGRLKVSHPQRVLFTSSSFLSEGNFLIAKLLLFCWTLGFLLASASESATEPKWQIFLTNWTFVLQTIYFFLGVIVVIKGMIERQEDIAASRKDAPHKPTTILHSIQWVFFSTNAVASITITVLYYSFLTVNNNIISVAKHAINSVTTFIDLFIINIPVRLLHYIFPFTYASIYVLFSVFYWAADGTNTKGKPYIYSILNWEDSPGEAAGYSLATLFVVGPLVQLLLFGLWRLRLVLSEQLNGAPITIFGTPLQSANDMAMSELA